MTQLKRLKQLLNKQMTEIPRLEVPATADNLAQIYSFVREACRNAPRLHFSEEKLYNIELAVGEFSSNIIEHGYRESSTGPVIVEVELREDRAVIKIRDRGRFFDFEKAGHSLPEDQFAEGGRGIYIIRNIADRVRYTRDEPYNLMEMEFIAEL